MSTTDCVRRLDPGDDTAVATLLDRDGVQNVFLRSELRLGSLRTGAWWAVEMQGGGLRSLVAGGSLVVPWLGDNADAVALARVVDRQRRPQLIAGPRDHVHALHGAQHPVPSPREVRDPQPLLTLRRGQLRAEPTPHLRRGTAADVDRLTVTSAAMHREEMGVDPLALDPTFWRMRMATLIERGWSFLWEERGEIIFKAELSAWTPEACLVQGVYTAPAWRARRVGTAGMAAVAAALLREVPLVTLYVNHFNLPARHLYARLGFEHVADFATLFF